MDGLTDGQVVITSLDQMKKSQCEGAIMVTW